ncbi:MAG: hypothetical protein AAGD09_06205 [Cyanobacteria bacterium P01_F01_bin.56]
MTPREHYLQLWQRYAQGLPSDSLELRVAQQALRDGVLPKEVTLMLVAGSETVRRFYEAQGKQRAMQFATHILQMAGNQKLQQHHNFAQKQHLGIEMGS